MTQGKDDGGTGRGRRGRKREWTQPELARLLAGEAQNHPGDSHADGDSTFS